MLQWKAIESLAVIFYNNYNYALAYVYMSFVALNNHIMPIAI